MCLTNNNKEQVFKTFIPESVLTNEKKAEQQKITVRKKVKGM
jgi:hypothetical protein